MGTSQQRKQLIHILISKIAMNKERDIDSIEIQINNDVITYLKRVKNKVAHPFAFACNKLYKSENSNII